jgi:integrase
MAEGIEKRHAKNCASRSGGRCRCEGGFRASVYSPLDGKKIRKTFPSRAEARSWQADAKRAVDHGALRTPTRRTLAEAASAWIEGAESGDIRNRSGQAYKPATLRGYCQALDTYVLPVLGGRKLSTITTSELQWLVDSWQAEGQAASTVRNTIKPLQAIYRRARSREGLPVNPTHDLELPAPRPKEVEIVSPEMATRLLAATPAQDRALWATALYAGLRYGELRALRWGAVDLAGGTIRIRESWDPREGSIPPKTKTSQRTTPLPGLLRGHLMDRKLAALDSGDDDLVFGASAETPFQAAVVYRRADSAWEAAAASQACQERFGFRVPDGGDQRVQFILFLADAGFSRRAIGAALQVGYAVVRRALADRPKSEAGERKNPPVQKLRLHQARHTYASFMIAAGVNAKALSTFMGHSSIKVTFDLYGHLMPGTEAEAAALLDMYLGAQLADGATVARAAA